MFHIIKFDLNQYDYIEIQNMTKQLQIVLPEEDSIMTLPYGIDVLLNVPKEELISIRNYIDNYLKQNMESEKD